MWIKFVKLIFHDLFTKTYFLSTVKIELSTHNYLNNNMFNI